MSPRVPRLDALMMPITNSKIFWWISTAGAVLLLATHWYVFYGHSIDASLHYGLANALYTHFGRSGVSREHLGFMYDYPPGSHWLAVIASLVTGYPLLSMNIISTLSIYLTYICIALLLMDRRSHADYFRALAMLLAIAYLASQRAAFGYHVIGNYFYPQLVGESLVFALLCLLSTPYVWTLPRLDRCFVLAAFTWLLGYIQPIAAMQFGGSAILVVTLRAIFPPEPRPRGWERLFECALVAAIVVASVLLNPSFRTMVTLALNDGALEFGRSLSASHYGWLFLFGITAAALAVAGALNDRLDRQRAFTLAAGCLSAAALLGMQTILYRYAGMGSPYAISKHVFFLAAVTATGLIYSTAGLIPSLRKPSQWIEAMSATSVPVFALLATLIVLRSAAGLRQDLRQVIEYQSFASHYVKYSQPIDGAGNIVSLNRALPSLTNNLISFGDLDLPFALAMQATIPAEVARTPVKYALVLGSADTAGVLRNCGIPKALSSTYSVVDRACFVEAVDTLPVDSAVRTVEGQVGTMYLKDGWGNPESWGTWSVSARASIEFEIRRPSVGKKFALVIKYAPFIAGARTEQAFRVVADGIRGRRELATDRNVREYVVPLEGEGRHTIEIEIENPVSPRELGLSTSDTRKLGIGVVELRLVPRS